ncbi:MAG: cobalamin B12-binding domain-containing protein [bacterium]
MAGDPIRILVAKPGLDGHDRGAKVVARSLRDAGFQVIYLGLRKTPAQIVDAAIQEDVDFIGLSVLSGAHIKLSEKVVKLLVEKDAEDIKVIVGGTIPERDIPALKALGVTEVFPTGADLKLIVDYIKDSREISEE